jgi:hypothetical protein
MHSRSNENSNNVVLISADSKKNFLYLCRIRFYDYYYNCCHLCALVLFCIQELEPDRTRSAECVYFLRNKRKNNEFLNDDQSISRERVSLGLFFFIQNKSTSAFFLILHVYSFIFIIYSQPHSIQFIQFPFLYVFH